ncbi:alpha/beta fold hydrolase [Crossiella cryophila]|uniref:ABC-2 type transport system ATP-binding protein n=1 Tax=Crossiella cryophila TaxID=43355 RepID=A0A7W7CHD1_9PSEU|nr:alpha/beta fold hydrolase [Crossiella cryophila]MBB4681209.1 ABC-2 type transport system ATP-binding protein [Crossiella cryophila]
MSRPSRARRKWSLLAVVALLLIAAGGFWWSQRDEVKPAVSQRELKLDVVDGPRKDEPVQLDATLYLPERTPAPSVIVAHGFGGNKNSVAQESRELAERGFVVLAYSARGFGASTGQIALNAPEYEVEDAKQLVDWLSRQPEVLKDADNDPKVGVTGGSYGGALALMLAGYDRRVDAIAPVITWNDLTQALLPNAASTSPLSATTPAAGAFGADGVFKRTWAGLFFSAGLGPASVAGGEPRGEAPEPGSSTSSQPEPLPGGAPGGQGSPGGQQGAGGPGGRTTGGPELTCGRFRPEVCAAYREAATTGRASQATVDLLQRSSPASVTNRITVPSMIVQGEADTLFGLDQADANARQIAAAGGKVKTVWYAGGHDGGAPGPALRAEIGQWFDFHLANRGSDPGTEFEYAVQGSFRRTGGPSVRTVSTSNYPGLAGDRNTPTELRKLGLTGPDQPALNPAGGNPAALSAVPGLSGRVGGGSGSSALATGLAVDIPGQFAAFGTEAMTEQVLIAGAPQVRLKASGLPGQPNPGEAVLFVKLYEVAKEGQRTLAGGAVAPIRVKDLPQDGSPVEVTVTLPGVVRPVAEGNKLMVVAATTDQAFAPSVEPAVYKIGLAGDNALSVPIVPGQRSASVIPWGTLAGIGGVLLVALIATVIAAIRRRRADDVDPDLLDTPLDIRDLTKSYPGKLTAVDGLSFQVKRGQVLGLLGPNGAGKTTTLRMLMGLVQPTEGEIRVFGHLVHSGAPVLSRTGSFVEGSGFLPHLSGTANLHLYWAATGRPLEEARFEDALQIAGLGTAVRRKVGTYSQGMRQRLAIAQAMLGLPDLLVLDEPANGLDPPQIHHMRDVLRRYAETGRTVVVSSHLLAEVEQTCSHVVVMHRGRLVAQGEVAEIVAGGGEVSFRVDNPEDAVVALKAVDGIGEVSADGSTVHADLGALPRSVAVNALVYAGVAVEQVGPRRRLEDAFLQLVGEDTVQ